MVRKVDPADLIDAHGVAHLLGLSSPSAVSVYRKRYEDFPQPVIGNGQGKRVFWLRQDIEAWSRDRKR